MASVHIALAKIKSALFRYAVYLDITVQLMSDYLDVDRYTLEEYRRRAINNVRRTKGRISLDASLQHTGISDEE